MSETPLKKRRATILVTGPQSKKTIFGEAEDTKTENENTIQDNFQIAIARQRLHNELAVVNTATGIEILMQIVMDELELFRYRIRESGVRMRHFFHNYLGGNQIRALIIRIFSKSISSRNMIEYKKEAKEIMNDVRNHEDNDYKMPRYTLNDVEEVLLTDDLEDGIIQRRSEKWAKMPIRQMPVEEEEDSFCEFRKLNVPMSMTFDDDDVDRLSMPSTRTQMTTEDQMASIQNQLAMLSKQLMNLQKGGALASTESPSSRASSRRGGRMAPKKPSIDVSSTSSSSDMSEDEGKGPSVCSPSLSLNRKVSESSSSKTTSSATITLAPMAVAPPPPPPPPPMMLQKVVLKESSLNTPTKPAAVKKTAANTLPAAETIVSNRPYLTDIANGRSLLKKTARSPGSSPSRIIRHKKRAVSSFEAALQKRFHGFHGDTSFSEQEENGDDDEVNATWDE